MTEAVNSAVAGLRTSVQRLSVAAVNIANARSAGALEPYDGFVPKRLVQSTGVGSAPIATALLVDDPAYPAYAPADPLANADGVVGMPNVNLPAQFVELSVAQRSYEANIVVLETTSELMKFLVDREV